MNPDVNADPSNSPSPTCFRLHHILRREQVGKQSRIHIFHSARLLNFPHACRGLAGRRSRVLRLEPNRLFGLKLDGLSIPILFTIALLCTLMSLYSIPYMAHVIGERTKQFGLYYALFLLYSVGMMGAVMATNLIEFYLFFELMLIPSYFLIAKWGYGDRDRISFMYFMWTHIGALSFLAGILWLGFLAGTPGQPIFDLGKIVASTIPQDLRLWVTILMVVGPFGEDGSVWSYTSGCRMHTLKPQPQSAPCCHPR